MEWRLGDEREMTEKLTCRPQLRWALGHLAPGCSETRLDSLIELVDRSMNLPSRHYHDLAHALMVAESNDPLDAVIGLFHDIVQAGVDGGLPPDSDQYIGELVGRGENGEFRLLDSPDALRDPVFDIVKRCFHFSDTEVLSPFAGQNEFLSALIACKAMSDLLDAEHLAAVTLGIEATVPFRKDPNRLSESYISALMDVNHRHQANIGESDMRSHIRRAVRIANRDVRSFGESDLIAFLDDTWGLMYESSSELRAGGSISVTQYRQTLQKMTRFLSSLAAPVIFRQFDGEPIQSDHQHRLDTTARNLAVIGEVMRAKLLAMALIESADSFGCRAFYPARLRSALRATKVATAMTAAEVLAPGASGRVEFDVRQSPLSHQLLQRLPPEVIREHADSIDLVTPVSRNLIERFPTEIQSRARELARAMLL
jgi:hypothetical protein